MIFAYFRLKSAIYLPKAIYYLRYGQKRAAKFAIFSSHTTPKTSLWLDFKLFQVFLIFFEFAGVDQIQQVT